MRVKERERKIERAERNDIESACLREIESECVCLSVRERKGECLKEVEMVSVCVCVCACDGKRER